MHCLTCRSPLKQIVPVFPSYLVEECGVPEDRVQFWLSLLLTVFGISNAAGSRELMWLMETRGE